MGLPHIEENKQWLIRGGLLNPRIDPFQLLMQTPGIASEVKVLKPLAELSTGFGRGIEPLHGSTSDGGVTAPPKPLHNIGSCELKTFSVLAFGTGVSHTKQLANLGVQPGLAGMRNPRGEANPESGMASISEITWSLSLMQRPNLSKRCQSSLLLKR